jgi:sensitive to high expression protein 9
VHDGTDALLRRLAVAGQRINEFTGTDYSGIEALRREIRDHERLVEARRAAVADARVAAEGAAAERAGAQAEVVALLERKPAWSAGDLERYMARLREGHALEARDRGAREGLERAERRLDEARARLDERVRARYHEEQVWSDTIRRNATWWTVGLMGLNVAILLVNVVAVEPWRRRRLVEEIRGVLEGRMAALEDGVEALLAKGEAEPVVEPAEEAPLDLAVVQATEVAAVDVRQIRSLDDLRDYVYGFFGQDTLLLRRVDLTAVAMQSGLVGAAVTAGVFMLLVRQR